MSSRHRSSAMEVGRNHGRASKMSHSFVVDQVLLEPWFLPRRVALAIRGIATPVFQKKLRYFFEDYGCMICKKETNYHSNGMCRRCRKDIRKKLAKCVKRRFGSKIHRRADLKLFRQEKLAKKLLGKFSPATVSSTARRIVLEPSYNPVYEALCPRFE